MLLCVLLSLPVQARSQRDYMKNPVTDTEARVRYAVVALFPIFAGLLIWKSNANRARRLESENPRADEKPTL
jgi:hypothetical protein